MNLSKQIQQEKTKISLLNKVVFIYKNQLFEQNVFNFEEKFVIQLFENKSINYLKNWLRINDKIKSLQ